MHRFGLHAVGAAMAARSRLAPVLRTASGFNRLTHGRALREPVLTPVRCFTSSGILHFNLSRSRLGRFTTDTYPELKRDPRFGELTESHVAVFRGLLGDGAVIDAVTDEAAGDDIEPFNADWMRKYRGHCRLVLKPGSTAEVSKILKYCNDNRLAVVPQGGNTGLVGGLGARVRRDRGQPRPHEPDSVLRRGQRRARG